MSNDSLFTRKILLLSEGKKKYIYTYKYSSVMVKVNNKN